MPSGDGPAFAFDDSEPSDLVHLSCKQGALRNQYTWDFIFCNASMFLIQQTRVEYLLWVRNVLNCFLYALDNIRVDRTLSLPSMILCSSRGNKVHTNGHVLCWGWEGAKTVTCHKRGITFHLIEEEAIASTLEGTETAICRKVDRSCPLRVVGSGQGGVSGALSGRAPCENWWEIQGMFGNSKLYLLCFFYLCVHKKIS